MSQLTFKRADTDKLDSGRSTNTAAANAVVSASVRWMVVPLSIILCVGQSVLSIYASNVARIIVTSTLIPVLAFAMLFSFVLILNPLMKLLYVGRVARGASAILDQVLGFSLLASIIIVVFGFATMSSSVVLPTLLLVVAVLQMVLVVVLSGGFRRAELMCVFAAMLVTSGISTFGLTEQLIPLITTPFNPSLNTPDRPWGQRLTPNMNTELYITDAKAIDEYSDGVQPLDDAGKLKARPLADAPTHEWFDYYSAVVRQIQWGTWFKPLSYWLIFIAGVYGIFYSLTYVLLGYWSQREKLIFPLARLPESLLPEDQSKHWLPPVFRSPGFWVGFALTFGIWMWNGAVIREVFGGVRQVPLGMSPSSFTTLVTGSMFEGAGGGADYATMFLIMFTAIGIAFLLPLEISFSIWFYFLLGRMMLIVAVWMGFGKNERDFPTDWLWANNLITAQGGGGFFLFSAICLWRAIVDYARVVRGKTLGRALVTMIPVFGLLVSMLVVGSWLAWNINAPSMATSLIWGFLLVFILTLLTVGVMRIVAEGGVYWFQSHTSFFHLFKTLSMGNILSPALLAPLLPIYSVLFLDAKAFMAPNLLNATNMQQNVGGGRTKFHINIVVCIILSVAVSLTFAIFLAHLNGAKQMHGWFYGAAPTYIIDTATSAATNPPQFDGATAAWYGLGALWVGLSIWLRATIFWWPHPIGYIMLINPLMSQLWFSFFIGWAFKKFIVRYGGKATFDKARLVFIGLIMGELMAAAFWLVTVLLYGGKGVDPLNRYS